MTPDFEALVAMVWEGRPGPLQHALRQLGARLRRPLVPDDYPGCVHELFRAFSEVAQPNGMPKRGRPSNDPERERLRLAYRTWVLSFLKDAYDEKRLLIRIAKETGGGEVISGTAYPIDEKPADLAIEELATEFSHETLGNVSPAAISKLLHPRGKKGTTR